MLKMRHIFLTSKLVTHFPKSLLVKVRKMSTDTKDVIIQDINDKGILILNRPKALNSLNLSMVDKLYTSLKKWETQKTLVLVKGSGDKAFCAGGDIKAIVEAHCRGEKLGHKFFKREYITDGLIGSYKIPYIAIIDGIVMGGGVGISVHGKYRIATEKTLFAMPETQIGLFPDVGGSYFLPRLEGCLGWYLALTGHRLKGADVVKAGIATHYCDSKDVKDLEEAILSCCNDQDIKKVLCKFEKPDNNEFSLKPYMEKINHCFSAPTVEEVICRLRNDGSKFAEDTINVLSKMCPTSLKITHKELQIGKDLNLHECLKMEYRMAVQCLENTEFAEGVRALLIDKDKKPKWNPPTLEEVTDELVDRHFAKLPEEQELKHKL